MQFKIQQVALCPSDLQRARRLLERLGINKWVDDIAVSEGTVNGSQGCNVAHLSFNYEALDGNELEVLHYDRGPNWVQDLRPCVSHLGMHCTEEELVEWKKFFAAEGVGIAQEVFTKSHTNQFLVDSGRRYHYCIFETRAILGTDLKFIVRVDP